jgi:RecB family exonuclease
VDDGLERQVSGTLGGVPIGGKIDRVEPGPGGLRIVDYKTGSAKPAFAGSYWRQQLIYAALMNAEEDTEPVGEVSLMFLGETSRVMTRPVPGSAIDRVTADLALAQAQRTAFDASAQWEARESGLCRFCPVARVCPTQATRAPIPGSLACDERLATSDKVRRSGRTAVDRDDELEVDA